MKAVVIMTSRMAHDVLDAAEGQCRVRLVVHGQEYAGDNHNDHHGGGQGAKIPEIGEIPRHREGTEFLLNQ